MKNPSCEKIANDFELWGEYVDPDATMSIEDFDALSIEEKVDLIHKTFPGCHCLFEEEA